MLISRGPPTLFLNKKRSLINIRACLTSQLCPNKVNRAGLRELAYKEDGRGGRKRHTAEGEEKKGGVIRSGSQGKRAK